MFAKSTIKKLGGIRPTARLLNISATAVFLWVHSKENKIPKRHHAALKRYFTILKIRG
jgi:hypothetical protein